MQVQSNINGIKLQLTAKKRALLRETINQCIQEQHETPELVQQITKMFRKLNGFTILQILFLVITSGLCAYQTYERIAYFLSGPKSVQVKFADDSEEYFPPVWIRKYTTVETMEFAKNFSAKLGLQPDEDPCIPFVLLKVTDPDDQLQLYYAGGKASFVSEAYVETRSERMNATKSDDVSIICAATRFVYDKPLRFNQQSKLIMKLSPDESFKCSVKTEIAIRNADFFPLYDDSDAWYQDLDMNYLTQIKILIKKTNLLNTNEYWCTDERQEVYNCLETCAWSLLELVNFTCRVPVMKIKGLQNCGTQAEWLKSTLKILSFVNQFDQWRYCSCPKPCELIKQEAHINIDSKEEKHGKIQLQPLDNTVRIATQYYTYNTISLLCDIGGNIGLYFGLSCLTLFEVCSFFKKLLEKNLKRRQYFLKIKIKALLAKNNKVETSSKKWLFVALNVILFLIATCEIYMRIDFFFAFPINTVNSLTVDQDVEYPRVLTCKNNNKICNYKRDIVWHTIKPCDDVNFLALLNRPSKLAGNPKKLWQESSSFEVDRRLFRRFPSQVFEPYLTPYGNCTLIYEPNKAPFVFGKNALVVPMRNYVYSDRALAFITPPRSLMDYQNLFVIPTKFGTAINLQRITFKRVNTIKTRCESQDKALTCRKKCFKEKISNVLWDCRLPYIKETQDLPYCNSTETATLTQNKYFEALVAMKNCSCHKMCNETVFAPAIVRYNEGITAIVTKFWINSNVREIFEEQLAYPIPKLLCDIGSLLGITNGLSLFSVITYFRNPLQKKLTTT